MKQQVIYPGGQIFLNERDREEKEFFDSQLKHFQCVKCKYIVNNPLECKGCDSLICKDCIPVEDEEQQCPGCQKGEKVQFGKVFGFVMKALQNLNFDCKHSKRFKSFFYPVIADQEVSGCC